MMVRCPMTSRIEGHVVEVVVSWTPPSVVLADQLESLDWRAQRARLNGAVSAEVLAEVRSKVKALLAP
jgi:mRNA interferase MazF